MVFKQKSYALLALGTSFLLFVLLSALPNRSAISFFLKGPNPLLERLAVVIKLIFSFFSSNTQPLSLFMLILILLAFGANAALIVYVVKHKKENVQTSQGTSFLGLFSGVLGVGCSACGSLIFTSILPFFGSLGFLTFFPLRGQEFSFIGIVLLGISIILNARAIEKLRACPIPHKKLSA